MRNCLITGLSGFFGKALKQRLLSQDYKLFEMNSDCDITDFENFNCFENKHIDHVFHLAAKTFVPDSWETPQSFYQTNFVGTVNVLEFCRKKSIPMTFLSAYLYGQPHKLPISEDDAIQPNNPYAHSKYLAEQACAFYSKEFGVSAVIVRPFNIYGIGQSVKYLIPHIIKQALEDKEIKVKDLTPRRDYVYLDDLIEALMLTVESPKKNAVYNIGTGTSFSVEEIINSVQKIVGTNKKVVSEQIVRKNEINDVVADITRANKDLGWYPKTKLHEGIKKVVEDIKNNYQQIPINKGNYSMESPERECLFERYRGEGWEEEYREYRKNWVEFAKNKMVSEYPLLVDAELASICNLKCPMCYTITDEFKEKVNVKLMDFELFKRIINEIGRKVPALRLSLRGESTLHPKFVECVKYAKDSGIKEVSFLTNGSRLTADFFETVLEAGADWITVSVDGLNDTYDGIRKPLKFKEILQKVNEMKEIKRKHNSHKPVIKVQSVWPAIRDNPEAYYNAFEPFVDLIAFNPLIDYLGKDSEIIYEDNFSCPQHYQRLVIGADGLTMMCSNDEEGSLIVGDANKESVYEMWHGEKLADIRGKHKKRDGFLDIPVCTKCYLPRASEDGERVSVNGREFIVRNYINRKQSIGD